MDTTRMAACFALALGTMSLGCSATTNFALDDANGGDLIVPDASVEDSFTEEEDASSEEASVDADVPDRVVPQFCGPHASFCPCPRIGECPSWTRPGHKVVARASDMGKGLRFVTMDGSLVLAENEKGEPLVYSLGLTSLDPTPMPFDPKPSPGMRARSIAGYASEGIAILCDDESCVAYRSHREEPTDDVFRLWATPLPMDSKDVVGGFPRADELGTFCVFGDGLHCTDGDEFVTIVSGERGKLLAVDSTREWLVGERGRALRIRYEDDERLIEEIETDVDIDLNAVTSIDDKTAIALGGSLVVRLSSSTAASCHVEGSDLRLVVTGPNGLAGYIDKAAGEFVGGGPGAYCTTTMPQAPVYALRRCMSSHNVWALTPDAIFAETECINNSPWP